ncbi:MAG: DUF6541 family protein [Patescibacteria group bacterium]
MISFISNQLLFYISIILVLFIPGYFLIFAIETRKKLFNSLERFIFSFGFSIIVVDLLMILMGKSGILFDKISIITAVLLFSAICFAINKIIRFFTYRRSMLSEEEGVSKFKDENNNIFNFSKNQKILIIILLFLTIFIKTAYFKNSIFPTSTDLGHHMYWSKTITETGKLPVYQESDIIQVNGNYEVSQPQNIADFIIGEHLIFSAINLISGIDFISYFPSLILFLIHIAGILAIFILALRLFENYSFGKNAAIISLFLLGPLYAISSSQAKFVSGGVIGNTIGNLLIPVALYFLFRALKEKKSTFLSLSIFSMLGLAYTHHLSTFIFIFVFIFTLLIFAILNIKNIFFHIKEWLKILIKPQIIILFLFSCFLILAVYTPAYLNTSVINTAVGGPSKETRAGLTFTQLKQTAGEARMALGLIGIIILLVIKKRNNYENVIVAGWGIALFAMSIRPDWLFLDLPSTRIANYISFPLAISGAFALAYFFEKLRTTDGKYYINQKMFYVICFMFYAFMLANGFYDNSQSLSAGANFQKAMQTFDASKYLSEKVSGKDLAAKDHNYLTADSWIKLYFMGDYNYPFSRGYFKRYEDTTNPREMCTLWIISEPNTDKGQKCLDDLGVNFMIVNPTFDSVQFQESNEFWQIYSGKEINIYYRNK